MAQNALGKHYREGMTLVQLLRMFPDDAAAEKWFVEHRWGENLCCPRCASLNIQSGAKHPSMPYRCRDCRRRFSVRTGTVMEGSNLGYQTWALAMYLLTTSLKGVSSMKLHRDLGITQKAAWHLAHRLRRAWEDDGVEYEGPVEVDETYIGGKERSKHSRKRLRAGRGAVGKTAVVGMKDRETNQIATEVVEATDKPTLQGFVVDRTADGATVYTDEHGAYRGLENHEAIAHSKGVYVDGDAHTNGIESHWALLKRGYVGTYHRMSPKHLHRYATEFEGRHNARPQDTREQMAGLVKGMEGRRLKYDDLIADEVKE